jgi:hypothetical protein
MSQTNAAVPNGNDESSRSITENSIESRPNLYARVGGALYLIIIALGIFSQVFVRDRVIVAGDAVATAANLLSMETLWRAGIATEVFMAIATVMLGMVYYYLLRPVHKEINLLAALLRMTSVTVQTSALVYLLLALYPLLNPAFTKAFAPDQLAVIASMAIRSHSYSYSMALLFTGCTFLVHGWLIYRSEYLRKFLGVLIMIAGIGYIANGFAQILFPSIGGIVFMAIILPVFIGETTLSLWLLIKGVDIDKWNASVERSRLSGAG